VLTEWLLTRTYKQRKKRIGNSQKWSQLLTGVVTYESFSLQSLSDKSNEVSQCLSQLELVAYESGCKESFDCIKKDISLQDKVTQRAQGPIWPIFVATRNITTLA